VTPDVETRRTRKHDTSKADASTDETTRVASDEPFTIHIEGKTINNTLNDCVCSFDYMSLAASSIVVKSSE